MPKREVLHRMREALELQRPVSAGSSTELPSLVMPNAPGARIVDVWSSFWSDPIATHCRAEAMKTLDGNISVFGHSWSTQTRSWNVDPVSGYEWPAIRAHRIDYRHSSGADPKWTWEVNRLLFLLPVAFAVQAQELDRLRGEEFMESTVSDWISRCQTGHGPQWAAAIEVAIRSIAITIAVQAIESPSQSFLDKVAVSIRDHANWIKRFPSAYSSANNHRVAELAALLVLDSSWQGLLSEAERDGYEKELANVSRSLFSSDGIGLEQSPTYAGFSLEFIALVLRCHEWSDASSRKRVSQIAHQAAYALAQFTNDDGTLIRYGDDDEGKVITVVVPDSEYSDSLVKLATGGDHVRTFGLQTFGEGGISLMRFVEFASETTWVFDHGPLGFGDIAAHGHSDTLSVSMRAGGIDWVVDAGTYRYHGDKKWRTYFRSSEAHNAPRLDDQDSSVMTGDFNWHPHKRAQGKLLVSRVEDGGVRLRATHDGYLKQGLGSVTRTLDRLTTGRYRITDTHDGNQRLSTAFIVNPACDVSVGPEGWTITHANSSLQIDVSVSGQTSTGLERPGDQSAWFSPAFGEKLPAWRLGATVENPSREPKLVFDFKFSDSSLQEA